MGEVNDWLLHSNVHTAAGSLAFYTHKRFKKTADSNKMIQNVQIFRVSPLFKARTHQVSGLAGWASG